MNREIDERKAREKSLSIERDQKAKSTEREVKGISIEREKSAERE